MSGQIRLQAPIYYQGANLPPNKASYDDEKGQFVMEVGDHIAYRYEIVKILGKGSFSTVVKVFDHKRRNHLAIKVVRNDPNITKHSHKEIDILLALKGEGNSIELLAHFFFKNHLCMVTDCYSINLWQVLKLNDLRGLDVRTIRAYAVQTLECLVVLEHHSIIHCDLKPENILLVSPNSSQIKVVDFGSSSFQDGKLFTYIQSRYYRAPEVIMELPYDCRIDIWSLACILAELFTGRPLFSGKDEFEQIRQFIAVLGPPPQPMLQRCRQSVREVIAATRGPTTELWQVIDPGRREVEFVSMLSQMLAWDRNCRLSPSAALAHPFFTGSRPISAQTGSAKYSAHPGNSQPVALTAQPLSSRLETPFVPPTPLSYITQLNQPYPSTLSFSQSSSHVPGGGLGNTSNCSAPAHGPSAELSNSTSSSTLRAQPKASTMRAAFASDAKATPRDRVPPRVQNLSSYSASTAGGGNAASSGISRQAPASRGPPPQQLFHTQLLHEQHMARERLAGPRAGHTQPGRNVQPQTWASR